MKKNAAEVLQLLVDGNARFVSEVQSHPESNGPSRVYRLAPLHDPLAIVIGCSDARVPAEIVFDQGLGNLFVIRVAGNIIAPSQIGSVEFAAERFGVPLVVVLGHSQCGAVLATLEELERPSERRIPNLRSIVDRVRPSVEPLLEAGLGSDPEKLIARAVRANIRASTNQLRHGSQIVENLIDSGQLDVIGAEYDLETGKVDFFDRLSR